MRAPCPIALTLAFALLSNACAQGKPSAQTGSASKSVRPDNRPPAIERITEHTFRVGAALVDTEARTIICPGSINMSEGPIEYLGVAPGGKTHESLLLLNVRPLHLQLALLMLNLEPKNILTRQGDPRTPQGDSVELRVRWRDRDGHLKEFRAEDLLKDASGKRMRRHEWVFTGSHILKQGFQADLEKSLIAVWHDPAAIVDNPDPGGASNGWLVDAARTPARQTPIELILDASKTSPQESTPSSSAKQDTPTSPKR